MTGSGILGRQKGTVTGMDQIARGFGVRRWTDCLRVNKPFPVRNASPLLIGILRGEGVGPEIIGAALDVLDAVTKAKGLGVQVCEGGPIGRAAEKAFAAALPQNVIDFCEDIFARGGAILHGPGGGRFVYDLRKEFDLFFKINPLQAAYSAPLTSRLKPDLARQLDVLLTRENSGGIYQGEWAEETTSSGRLAWHRFAYAEDQVNRFLQASARLAKQRRGELTVVWKESGLPSISKLWRGSAEEVAKAIGVQVRMIDFDVMAYQLVHDPHRFDVVAAPNLIGDVLADLGAALLGARGASFSGNYDERGNAVYQTNHGSAHDLAGTDRANPAGQIFALAMMLRESFGCDREAAAIEAAVRSVWSEGWRTEDIASPGAHIVGTREMGCRVAERAAELLEFGQRPAGARVGDEAASPSC